MIRRFVSLDHARRNARGETVPTPHGGVHVVVRGAGRDVVLIHGVTDNATTWRQLEELAAGSVRTHAIDLPGHGLADDPVRPLTVREMAESVVAYLTHAGISNALLVGNSMGGGVASGVAVLAPERVRGVVLVGSIGVKLAVFPPGLRLLRVPGIGEALGFVTHPRVQRTIIRGSWDQSFRASDAVLADYFAPWRIAGRARYLRALLGTLDAAEPSTWLPTLAVPTTVLHGDHDALIPLEAARRLHALIPNATLTVLEHTGHQPQIERPAAVWEVVRAHLDARA